jgi:hypothetical protein
MGLVENTADDPWPERMTIEGRMIGWETARAKCRSPLGFAVFVLALIAAAEGCGQTPPAGGKSRPRNPASRSLATRVCGRTRTRRSSFRTGVQKRRERRREAAIPAHPRRRARSGEGVAFARNSFAVSRASDR